MGAIYGGESQLPVSLKLFPPTLRRTHDDESLSGYGKWWLQAWRCTSCGNVVDDTILAHHTSITRSTRVNLPHKGNWHQRSGDDVFGSTMNAAWRQARR